MADFYNKYLKYKIKYLELKSNNMIGGGKNKIFDLDNEKQFKFTENNISNNLNLLEKELGSSFTIKYTINSKPIYIDVVLKKIKSLTNVIFYSLIFSIPFRTTSLMNIKLDFIDPLLIQVNNNSYISNIQRTKEISGSELVQISIRINQLLKVKKIYIYDGTTVQCNKDQLDLSFLKLIEKKHTFYMKFGFDFEVTNTTFFYQRFANKADLKNEINKLIENIRKIKTLDIIKECNKTIKLMAKIIEEENKHKLQISLISYSNPTLVNEFYKENPEDSIIEIIGDCKDVADILNKYKNEKLFYKVLVKLFTDDCTKYNILFRNIITNAKTKIIYGKEIINREYVIDFDLLMGLRYAYIFSYTFK